MPIVDMNFRLNVPSVYCCRKLDLPTPESPSSTAHADTVAKTQASNLAVLIGLLEQRTQNSN